MPNSAEETGPCKIEFGKLGRPSGEGGGAVPRRSAQAAADQTRCNPHAAQGVYGLALGGEDLNDHGSLRDDVAMQTRLLPMSYY